MGRVWGFLVACRPGLTGGKSPTPCARVGGIAHMSRSHGSIHTRVIYHRFLSEAGRSRHARASDRRILSMQEGRGLHPCRRHQREGERDRATERESERAFSPFARPTHDHPFLEVAGPGSGQIEPRHTPAERHKHRRASAARRPRWQRQQRLRYVYMYV